MYLLTRLSCLALPTLHRAFIQPKGLNDGLRRATKCQQRHDSHEQVAVFLYAIPRCALRLTERLAAVLALVALLFARMAHDISVSDALTRS